MFGMLSAVVLAVAMSGCVNKAATGATDAEELRVDSISMEQDGLAVNVSFDIDYPVAGNALLVDSLRSYIAFWIDGDMSLLSDGNALLKKVFQHKCTELESEREEFMASLEVTDYLPYEYSCQVKLQGETDTYVTYSHSVYEFEGGAHGISYGTNTTFCKSDGRHMGWNMLKNTDSPAFHELIVKGLLDYFDVEDEAGLNEVLLLLDGVRSLPLPASAPWLTEKGMVFCYQQYEIAPYAYGMPSFVLGYEQLLPFLSDEAKVLLKL